MEESTLGHLTPENRLCGDISQLNFHYIKREVGLLSWVTTYDTQERVQQYREINRIMTNMK